MATLFTAQSAILNFLSKLHGAPNEENILREWSSFATEHFSSIESIQFWIFRQDRHCPTCVQQKSASNSNERSLHLIEGMAPQHFHRIDQRDCTFMYDPYHQEAFRSALFETSKRETTSSLGRTLEVQGQRFGYMIVHLNEPMSPDLCQGLEDFYLLSLEVGKSLLIKHIHSDLTDSHQRWKIQNSLLKEEISQRRGLGYIVGNSPSLQNVLEKVKMVAPTDASVLIAGESGTGKELIAQAIHEQSSRRDKPLIRVNCASIPKELFESEFFGHVKGAFTGAHQNREGRFQMADGGTLFLDEIGEIPLELQSKLLRVLQEEQFEKVGDDHTHKVDVRIIAATNRVLDGNPDVFRQDLYYRLSVFPIESPPLRERLEDIEALAHHFTQEACKNFNREPFTLASGNITSLRRHDWPGNIRELKNVIERAVITSRNGHCDLDFLSPKSSQKPKDHGGVILKQDEIQRLDTENTIKALTQARGKISGPGSASELLGLPASTLNSRILKMGLCKEDFA